MSPHFSLYGLIDCNSFFASCEKVFRPDLADKPVVVLSNNDGVVVSRSAEAKAIGIPMGEPFFKIKRIAELGKVVVFSSNYRLYGDMSSRVMSLLNRWTPDIEIYSIDEAFMNLTAYSAKPDSLPPLMNEIVTTIKQWTGIPVSLGVGNTMTLAKVANDIAKKGNGICSLLDVEERKTELSRLEIGDVWGIGRNLAPKMRKLGIRTAQDLASMNPLVIRREFSVTQEQLVRELNGEHCLDITGVPAPRKNIQVSRSFHDATDNYQTLSEAVSTFAAKACEKARAEGTVASAVYVHLNTSRFLGGYISEGLAHGFDIPTSHTPTVIRAALRLCRNLYRPNQFYKKASVMLLDLRDAAAVKSQGLLFRFTDQTPEEQERENRLMESIDQINRVLGKDTLFFGSQGTQRGWHGASEHRSPGYTVNWKEIPVVRAK